MRIIEYKKVTPHKQHVCSWCGKLIDKKETHNYFKIRNNKNKLDTWREHLNCRSLFDKLYKFQEDYEKYGEYGISPKDFFYVVDTYLINNYLKGHDRAEIARVVETMNMKDKIDVLTRIFDSKKR